MMGTFRRISSESWSSTTRTLVPDEERISLISSHTSSTWITPPDDSLRSTKSWATLGPLTSPSSKFESNVPEKSKAYKEPVPEIAAVSHSSSSPALLSRSPRSDVGSSPRLWRVKIGIFIRSLRDAPFGIMSMIESLDFERLARFYVHDLSLSQLEQHLRDIAVYLLDTQSSTEESTSRHISSTSDKAPSVIPGLLLYTSLIASLGTERHSKVIVEAGIISSLSSRMISPLYSHRSHVLEAITSRLLLHILISRLGIHLRDVKYRAPLMDLYTLPYTNPGCSELNRAAQTEFDVIWLAAMRRDHSVISPEKILRAASFMKKGQIVEGIDLLLPAGGASSEAEIKKRLLVSLTKLR